LRYTEILTKNNHLVKGELLLKKYTEKYPKDNRILSRYGYFTLWLGKNHIAIQAFEKALVLKPYFKEAMDGLDLAKGKDNVYTFKDSKKNLPKQQEYAVDSYYKKLAQNPNLIEIRYSLINELINNNRIEEAFEQLQFLQKNGEADSSRFQEKFNIVQQKKDSTYKKYIENYSTLFEKNTSDKEIAIKLSSSYSNLYDYDNAIAVLEKYLENIPEDKGLELRYVLAKNAAWSYQWEKAFRQTNLLIKNQPDNLEYQLLMGQLISWNVLNSDSIEYEKGKFYLNNVLKKNSDRLEAIDAMAFLLAGMSHFEEALKYIELVKEKDPASSKTEALLNFYNARIETFKARQILTIRNDAGNLAEEGKCKEAAEKYKEIFNRTETPSKDIYVEFANFSNCAGNYQDAIDALTKTLSNEFDFELATLRAENRIFAGDTITALVELHDLYQKDPANYAVIFNLGDLLEKTNKGTDALNLYNQVINDSKNNNNFLDSIQISGLKTRISYLGNGGSGSRSKYWGGIGISPLSVFYYDNKDLIFYYYGSKTEINLSPGFSVGGKYLKYYLKSSATDRYLTSFSGLVQYSHLNLFLSGGIGKTKTLNNSADNYAFNISYEKKNEYGLFGSFEKNDARAVLYSPFIINSNMDVRLFKFTGYYNLKNNFYLYGYFGILTISDGNKGNDFQLKPGRLLGKTAKIGYEYYLSNYAHTAPSYYSPESFESHSLWVEYAFYQNNNLKITSGGKLGYVPSSDYILREIYVENSYLPIPIISINAKITLGSTYRDGTSYDYLSAFVSAYLSIF
ncbi:MAG: tetratricopeptide repeat protein, partial [Methanococcaceae archaeon]